jgi:ATP-dependent Lon protease
MVANPLICLDELEKASKDRKNGSLLDGVLPLLEPSTRKAYWDPYLECAVDLSAMNIVATVNDSRPLRGPVLDRFVLLHAPQPGPQHLEAIVTSLLRQVREASGRDPRWIADLDGAEWDVLRKGYRGGSIRPLKRALDRLLSLRRAPGIVH